MLEDAGPNKPGEMSYILDGVSLQNSYSFGIDQLLLLV
jgi:hypothetical protein